MNESWKGSAHQEKSVNCFCIFLIIYTIPKTVCWVIPFPFPPSIPLISLYEAFPKRPISVIPRAAGPSMGRVAKVVSRSEISPQALLCLLAISCEEPILGCILHLKCLIHPRTCRWCAATCRVDAIDLLHPSNRVCIIDIPIGSVDLEL